MMTKETLQFKQFCYTHTRQGIYGKKGWQAVGVSDEAFFKPLLPKIQSTIAIPESAQFQRTVPGFKIFGLHKIGNQTALIKITDAGKTSDNRPGNIFVHLLMPNSKEDEKKFFDNPNSLLILEKWEGWLKTWEESWSPKMDIATIELDTDTGIHESRCKKVNEFLTQNNINPEHLITAAQLALEPRKPRFLLIQPKGNHSNTQQLELLSFIWSLLDLEKRPKINFWMGIHSTPFSM